MKVVFSERHRAHAYAHEVAAGVPIPAWEVPERAEHIRNALLSAGHELMGPVEHGRGPIEAVHDRDMLRYLETAWKEWTRAGIAERDAIIPDTMPLPAYHEGMSGPTEPQSPCGRIGYWCFDTMTPIVEGTYGAARAAVDVALTAAGLIASGEPVAYALCRPPGHHAARATFGGYCYLNNAAIAAHWLAVRTGSRLGLLDIDYHHGNGTQQIFYRRAEVAYASIHGDPRRMYPYFSGHAAETGAGDGTGANLNQPMAAGTDDRAYLAALDRSINWLLDRSDGPVVVSLGFDTFGEDPICDFALTTPVYRECGRRVAASGRPLLLIQEGGYHLPSLGTNAAEWLGGAADVTAR